MKSSRKNSLDVQAIRQVPLVPLNLPLLSKFIDSNYVEWVNRTLNLNFIRDWNFAVCSAPKIGGVLRKIGLCRDSLLKSYYAYVCLKPLQVALERNFNKF